MTVWALTTPASPCWTLPLARRTHPRNARSDFRSTERTVPHSAILAQVRTYVRCPHLCARYSPVPAAHLASTGCGLDVPPSERRRRPRPVPAVSLLHARPLHSNLRRTCLPCADAPPVSDTCARAVDALSRPASASSRSVYLLTTRVRRPHSRSHAVVCGSPHSTTRIA